MTNKHYKKSRNSSNYNHKYNRIRHSAGASKPLSKKEIYANIPGRNIYAGENLRILSKDSLQKSDLAKSKIIVPLSYDCCQIPRDYSLANLPINVEKACLQSYHIPFSKEQLGEMFTSPKVAIDRFHNTYVFNGEVMHRTSFYLVAPNQPANVESTSNFSIINQSSTPILYRFSICRSLENKQHYSISMHAIVGGKEDGFLFLARLDNNNKLYHDFLVEENEKQSFFKKYSAVPLNVSEKTQQIMQIFEDMTGKENGDEVFHGIMYRIAFPHIHQADANYEKGEEPEKSCPKFLKKCANNTFEENVAFMMKAFHIAETPEFYTHNERLEKVVLDKRNTVKISPDPNPQKFVDEINLLEQYNSSNDFELVKQPKAKKQKLEEAF